MKRREFLKRSAPAVTLPFLMGGVPIRAIGKSSFFEQFVTTGEENNRILVLVQLNGGNDGLNTIIPLDQYSNLFNARSNVLIPEEKVISLIDDTGLHPSMSSVHSLFQEKKIGILQGVGYPNPNFSHFRSTEIMVSASDADEVIKTGWLGRYLDRDYPEYPEGFPNDNTPDPLAITMGAIVSTTCQGPITNMGIAISRNDALYNLNGEDFGEVPDNNYGHELSFIRQTQLQTQLYLQTVSDAASKAQNLSSLYPEAGENTLADQLKIVAQLIAGGLQTSIYVVSLGGFDTHAEQIQMGTGTDTGLHADLLQKLSDAILAFQDDLNLLGHEDRVVGMTFSEFGRRIRSNISYGTDHGTSGPVIVFGTSVNPILQGDNPEIPASLDQEDNLPMQFDFRSVYGSILKDWFCVDEQVISTLLFRDFQYLPVIKTDNVTGLEDEITDASPLGQNYPNPANNFTTIKFRSSGGHLEVSLFDFQGKKIETFINKNIPVGEHELRIDTGSLRNAIYYYQMKHANKVFTKKMVVQR
ncbi:DUF1501 domain-containing protein [Fulvivirgaceae bacterium BMA10]|uniref:DUF1501 domain-containing protein n=1 Tax=Splendidivirga corallicola TaxID=3051826 RepID=A0ABT8KUV9_9BACT|nr:DUF1501 domain-containing protein [Fulvivirgaceae bacterium BMA10]